MDEFSKRSGRRFGTKLPAPAKHKTFSTTSCYIGMRDGVRIAVDVFLPDDLDEAVPTISAADAAPERLSSATRGHGRANR